MRYPKNITLIGAICAVILLATTGCKSNNSETISPDTSAQSGMSDPSSVTPAPTTLPGPVSGLVLSVADPTVSPGGTDQLSASGGTGGYVFSILQGTGKVDPSSGLFTAPMTSETDTILVSDSSGQTTTATVEVQVTITVTPGSETVSEQDQVMFSATGGMAPYTYNLIAGGGALNGNVYTAPRSTGTAQILVSDLNGVTTTVILTIVAPSPLQISPQGANVTVNDSLDFSASGGNGPYIFSVISGGGSFNQNIYVAPAKPQFVIVQVTDRLGRAISTYLNVEPFDSATPLITGFWETLPGSHVIGGFGCPQGYTSAGSMADTAGGKIYGNLNLCLDKQNATLTQLVASDIVVTAGGAHIAGGVPCPGGYFKSGKFPDCFGGKCLGSQLICIKYTPFQSASQVVTDFYLTPEGEHVVGGPACRSGYSQVGSAADCGYGFCYGRQNFCAHY